jgi:glycosyltransferase involved in cell wall biosynthesis
MLVSAIMPTRGRAEWAAEALNCFREQTYPARELIILDDEEDPSFPGGAPGKDGPELVFYFRCRFHPNIPTKRNRCCQQAKGDVICHWDSDDWSAADRIEDQMARLQSSGKAVAGYHSMLFFDETTGLAWHYAGAANYAIGSSLAYRKSWWAAHPFDENLKLGEDNAFVYAARGSDQLTVAAAESRMVARIHAGNSYPKHVTDSPYRAAPLEQLPPAFRRRGRG